MTTVPYIPFYVSDYLGSTGHLSLEEHGIYMMLLMQCWQTPGCSIPADSKWIKRRLRVNDEVYDDTVQLVIEEFFQVKNGRLFQKRLKAEFDSANKKVSARKKAGSAGGRAKSLKNKETDPSKATAKTSVCSSIQNQNHIDTNVSIPPIPPKGTVDQGKNDLDDDLPLYAENQSTQPAEPEQAKAKRVADTTDYQAILDGWNEYAARHGLPQLKVLTDQRKRAIRAREKEHSSTWFVEVIAEMERGALMRGEADGTWKPSFDWVLKPANYIKIMEGNYRDDPNRGGNGPQQSNGGSTGHRNGGYVDNRTRREQEFADAFRQFDEPEGAFGSNTVNGFGGAQNDEQRLCDSGHKSGSEQIGPESLFGRIIDRDPTGGC